MKSLALTTAFLALACAVTIALAQDEPAPEPKPQPAPKELTQAEKDALATRAYFVLRNRCWGCHGEPGKTAYGETVALDWILDYDKLVEAKLVIPGKVKESRLIYLTTLGKMPREFDENGKPSKEGELPEAEQKALIEWVKAGAPKWPKIEYEMEWVPIGPGPVAEGQDRTSYLIFTGWRGHPAVIVGEQPLDGTIEIQEYRQGKWHVAGKAETVDNLHVFGVCDPVNKRNYFYATHFKWGGETRYIATWDGDSLEMTGSKPGPSESLANYGLVFDEAAARVILFGGYDSAPRLPDTDAPEHQPQNDCWSYKDGKFTRIEAETKPPAFRNPAFGYDPVGKRSILLTRAGDSVETWQLSGNQWKRLKPAHWPTLGDDYKNLWVRPTWDPEVGRLVLHGADNAQSETWAWLNDDWKLLTKAVPPPGKNGAGIAWDPDGQRMIYYQGGDGAQASIETWALIPWRKAQ